MLWWTLRKLASENAATRRKAVRRLGQRLGRRRKFKAGVWARGIPRLSEALLDGDAAVRTEAADALAGIGPAVVPWIIGKDDTRPILSEEGREAVVRIGNHFELLSGLYDERADVRRAVAIALGEMGDQRAREALAQARQDGNRAVREAAAAALAKLSAGMTPESTPS